MSWTEIRDQEGAIALLTRAIATDRIAPAYLFVGPPSIGKALTARVFAQALNCARADGSVCGACAACHTIASGNFADLWWARPEKRSRTIRAETARAATHALALAPQAGRYRVAVFEDAECLHLTGQNALLKTLEEPAPHALIVLVTAEPAGLLPTVRSRCQLVRFRPLETPTVAALLEAEGVPATAARPAAAAANGRVAPARLLADSGRLAFLRELTERAVAGHAASAAADHARDLDAQEKALDKTEHATELDPDLLSREQRARLEEERVARVQREMADRVEADLQVLAFGVRDGLALQAGGNPDLCVLGAPLPAFAHARPDRLMHALRDIDRARTYLRQYIRRDRVLFDLYGTIERAGAGAAA